MAGEVAAAGCDALGSLRTGLLNVRVRLPVGGGLDELGAELVRQHGESSAGRHTFAGPVLQSRDFSYSSYRAAFALVTGSGFL